MGSAEVETRSRKRSLEDEALVIESIPWSCDDDEFRSLGKGTWRRRKR